MTEDEAKTKWCPMVRMISDSIDGTGHVGPFNRMVLNVKPDEPRLPPSGNCIGSACMMWEPFELHYHKDDVIRSVKQYEQMTPVEREGYELIEGGDCGLKSVEPYCGYPA